MRHLALHKTLIILFATSMLLLSGCSRIYVSQDYDVSTPLKVHATYQWLPSSMQKQPSIDEVSATYPFVAKRIQKAILNHLIPRASVFVKKAPEAYISYHYSVIENRRMEPSTTVGFGWQSRHFGFWNAFPVNYTEVVTREASWTIDVHSTTGELIWRGQSTGAEPVFETAQETLKHTQTIIDAILNQYPPQ